MALHEDEVTTLGFCAAIFIDIEKFTKTRVDFDISQFKPLALGDTPTNKVLFN